MDFDPNNPEHLNSYARTLQVGLWQAVRHSLSHEMARPDLEVLWMNGFLTMKQFTRAWHGEDETCFISIEGFFAVHAGGPRPCEEENKPPFVAEITMLNVPLSVN